MLRLVVAMLLALAVALVVGMTVYTETYWQRFRSPEIEFVEDPLERVDAMRQQALDELELQEQLEAQRQVFDRAREAARPATPSAEVGQVAPPAAETSPR